jgi:hypothetical protein
LILGTQDLSEAIGDAISKEGAAGRVLLLVHSDIRNNDALIQGAGFLHHGTPSLKSGGLYDKGSLAVDLDLFLTGKDPQEANLIGLAQGGDFVEHGGSKILRTIVLKGTRANQRYENPATFEKSESIKEDIVPFVLPHLVGTVCKTLRK